MNSTSSKDRRPLPQKAIVALLEERGIEPTSSPDGKEVLYRCPLPGHEDNNPSFGVNTEKNPPHFDRIAQIFLVVEPDTGGRRLLERLSKSPLRARLHPIHLGHKSISEEN